jgi:hypothetical protein
VLCTGSQKETSALSCFLCFTRPGNTKPPVSRVFVCCRDAPPRCLPGYKRSLCNQGARGASLCRLIFDFLRDYQNWPYWKLHASWGLLFSLVHSFPSSRFSAEPLLSIKGVPLFLVLTNYNKNFSIIIRGSWRPLNILTLLFERRLIWFSSIPIEVCVLNLFNLPT